MQSNLKIKLLADCPEYISPLAYLWFNELGKAWIPNASVERAKETYRTHANKDIMPMTFVAIYENKPIAMASLREDDGIGNHFSPYLGSLIVHPDYRRRGIGELLINLVKQQAKVMGHDKLYLIALDPTLPNWYTRLGWKYIGMDKLYHHPVTVMEIEL